MNKLDSPKTTIKRVAILRSKKYLYNVYTSFYNVFADNSKYLPKGLKVEIGSGAGFIKDSIPGVITSDLIKLPFVDKVFPAEKMPFKNNSVSAFYLLNTFHHIKDPKRALSEMQRCLKKGGKIIMIEPANTLFSKFIYKNFHHESFDENASWKTKGNGALSQSNQALPWIIFKRDQTLFNKFFPGLKLTKYENHTPLNYLISGGFSYDSLLPAVLFKTVAQMEKQIYFINDYAGLFSTIVVKKTNIPKNPSHVILRKKKTGTGNHKLL